MTGTVVALSKSEADERGMTSEAELHRNVRVATTERDDGRSGGATLRRETFQAVRSGSEPTTGRNPEHEGAS